MDVAIVLIFTSSLYKDKVSGVCTYTGLQISIYGFNTVARCMRRHSTYSVFLSIESQPMCISVHWLPVLSVINEHLIVEYDVIWGFRVGDISHIV